jgi:WD40 repeat protein
MGMTVTWCPDRIGNAFLVFWRDYHQANPTPQPLERLCPPWSAGPTSTAIKCAPFVHQLRLSPSGQLLAIGGAGGNWKTVLWDLKRQEQVCELQNDPNTAPHLLFSPDDSHLIEFGQDNILVFSTSTAKRIAKHAGLGIRCAAMHPSGVIVIGDSGQKLILFDPLSGKRIKTLCLGGKHDLRPACAALMGVVQQGLNERVFEQVRTQMEKQLPSMMESLRRWTAQSNAQMQSSLAAQGYVFESDGTLNVEQSVAAIIEKMQRSAKEQQNRQAEAFNRPGVESSGITGTELPFSMLCSPNGRWLFCGTERGLRVYDWSELSAAKETTPPPRYQVDGAPVTVERGSQSMLEETRIRALAFDESANRLLFAGTDGVIRCLDLANGLHRTLLVLPGKTQVWEIGFSSNQRYLCCTIAPPVIEDMSHNGPPSLQVWDYARLIEQMESQSGLRLYEGDD